MQVELKTLRQVALALPNQTLDLLRFDADIALIMQEAVSFEIEGDRLMWIVGTTDETWAVTMPGDQTDISALAMADGPMDMARAGLTYGDMLA